MTDEIIGKNLKAFRETLGLTQEYVAQYLNIKREMLSYYETGARPAPVLLLMKFADLYDADLKEILEDNPKQSKLNKAFAFRAANVTDGDMDAIVAFKRIARNYIKIKDKSNE
jgi:transcriptional regulator with XRE-family HTH domain